MTEPKKNKQLLSWKEAVELAKKAGAKFPEVTAAQYAVETAWGTKQANAKNNLFNIKYKDSVVKKLKEKGINAKKGNAPAKDNATGSMDYYIAFDSIEDAFKGHQVFLETNSRYEKALKAETMAEYTSELQKAGYMEDPAGANKLYSMAMTQGKKSDGYNAFNPLYTKNAEKIKKLIFSNKNKTKEEIEERNKIEADYREKVEHIYNQKLPPLEEKMLFDELHKEAYREGNLRIIRHYNKNLNDRRRDFYNNYPSWENLSPTLKNEHKNPEQYYTHRRLQFQSKHWLPGVGSVGNNFLYDRNMPVLPNDLTDYLELDKEYIKEQNALENQQEETTSEDNTDNTDSINNNKDNNLKRDPINKMPDAWEDPYDQFLAAQDIGEPNEFRYEKGGFELPLEGIVGLAAGVAGMQQANQPMPARDEVVSHAIMNYAAELKKISQIGLPPEIEGDLKGKLAMAYQTGLENLVRASGGNRNLVLGNQGQLDMARMNGIVEMATLDVDRRDKAMAAYGEVAKYINEFDARRDISNNERLYREAEKNQSAGMALAQAGFAKLMDELAYQRENGPGSANDMMKQYFLTSIYGYNPKAKNDGKPGSKAYADMLAENRKATRDAQESYGKWLADMPEDERKKVAEILKDKPGLNPMRGGNALESFENLKTAMYGNLDADGNTIVELTDEDLAQTAAGFDMPRIQAQNPNKREPSSSEKLAPNFGETALESEAARKATARENPISSVLDKTKSQSWGERMTGLSYVMRNRNNSLPITNSKEQEEAKKIAIQDPYMDDFARQMEEMKKGVDAATARMNTANANASKIH